MLQTKKFVEYFSNCKEARSSQASYDEEAARRLWDISTQMSGVSA